MSYVLTRDKIIVQALRGIKRLNQSDVSVPAELLPGVTDTFLRVVQALPPSMFPYTYSESTIATPTATVFSISGTNYTCIRGVTTAAANKPTTGAIWQEYFVASGTGGVAWSNGFAAVSNNEFTIADAGELDAVWMRYNNSDYPIKIITDFSYWESIMLKNLQGLPEFAYADYSGALSNGQNTVIVRLYPQPSNSLYLIGYRTVRPITPSTTNAIAVDIPNYAYDYIVKLMIAVYAMEFTLPMEEINARKADAEKAKTQLSQRTQSVQRTGIITGWSDANQTYGGSEV